MAMWVVQAHREGRWAAWGPQGLDLVIQRSGMGAVPGCTRAGLPMVARRGSEVRGKLDKGDKPRKKWCARCVEVHRRVCRWAQSPGGGWVGQSGCACMCKVGMMEIGCGGYLGGTPPIGKLEPLGLISGEMVLQDGWQGRCRWAKNQHLPGLRGGGGEICVNTYPTFS